MGQSVKNHRYFKIQPLLSLRASGVNHSIRQRFLEVAVRLTHRAVRLALGLVTGLTLTLIGTVPASAVTTAEAGSTAGTWKLRDVQQRICLEADDGHPGMYFFAPVVGTW